LRLRRSDAGSSKSQPMPKRRALPEQSEDSIEGRDACSTAASGPANARKALSPRRRERTYSEYEVDRGLAEVALCAGHTRLASSRLKETGLYIPRSTLGEWARRRMPTATKR
jgi:hypothetical protein